MKKILKVVACFMFVVLATLGFAGCAKKISLKEANKIIDSMSDTNLFAIGVEISETYEDDNQYRKVLYDEEGHVSAMYQKDGSDEFWTDGTWLYVKTTNGENVVKEKALLSAKPSKFNIYSSDIEDAEKDPQRATKKELKEIFSAYSAYSKYGDITYKKEESKKNLTLSMEINAKVEGSTFKIEIEYVYKNKKLVEAKMYQEAKNGTNKETSKISIKSFKGTIEMPEDADNYTDISV